MKHQASIISANKRCFVLKLYDVESFFKNPSEVTDASVVLTKLQLHCRPGHESRSFGGNPAKPLSQPLINIKSERIVVKG